MYRVQAYTVHVQCTGTVEKRHYCLTCNSSSVKFSPSSLATLLRFLNDIFPCKQTMDGTDRLSIQMVFTRTNTHLKHGRTSDHLMIYSLKYLHSTVQVSLLHIHNCSIKVISVCVCVWWVRQSLWR